MKISVYITSYNQKHLLEEAVRSVLSQTLKPHQIIIVDDCSYDGSQELISGFCSRFPDLITPIYHPCNTGIAQVRTDALQAVTGDYVTYVDGDDRILPTKLETEASVLNENPQFQAVFSNYYYIAEDGKNIGVWADQETPPEGFIFCEVFARKFPRQNLFRNELVNYLAWKRVGFYDANLLIFEDYDMRIRLSKQLNFVYCRAPLSEYRLNSAGLSNSGPYNHFEAINYIYHKNKSLLDDLNVAEKKYVKRSLKNWIITTIKAAMVASLREKNYRRIARLFIAAMGYDLMSPFCWPLISLRNHLFRPSLLD